MNVTESRVLDALVANADDLAPIFEREGLDVIAASSKLRRMADVRRRQAAGKSDAAKFNQAAAARLVEVMRREGVSVAPCGYVMQRLQGVANGMKAVAIMRECEAQGVGKLYKAPADGEGYRAGSLLLELI